MKKNKKTLIIIGVFVVVLFIILVILFFYKDLAKKIEYNRMDKYLVANDYIKHSFYEHEIWKGYDYYFKGDCESNDWQHCTKVYPFTLSVKYTDISYTDSMKKNCDYNYNFLTNYGSGNCMIDGVLTNFNYDFNTGVYSSSKINFNSNIYEVDRSQDSYMNQLFKLKEEAILAFSNLEKYY